MQVKRKYLHPVPHGITVLLLGHLRLLQHEELADKLVGVFNLRITVTGRLYVVRAILQDLHCSRTNSGNLCRQTTKMESNIEKIASYFLIDEIAESLLSNLASSRIETSFSHYRTCSNKSVKRTK